jgi:hypothetical protein
MKHRARVSIWIISNKTFNITNLKVCNLAEFGRQVSIKNIHSVILMTRLKSKEVALVDGWEIRWSYENPFAQLLHMKNVPVAKNNFTTRKRSTNTSYQDDFHARLKGRKAFN